jgi:ribosomal protein S4E
MFIPFFILCYFQKFPKLHKITKIRNFQKIYKITKKITHKKGKEQLFIELFI